MWEDQQRTDYAYSATMDQAGCLREAQTWEAMLNLEKNVTSAWSLQVKI